MFGLRSPRPPKGGVIEGNFDFQALNIFMPHPYTGWGGWIAVNNPDAEKCEKSQELAIAYDKALKAAMKKLS